MSNNIEINYLSFLNSYIEDCALLHAIYTLHTDHSLSHLYNNMNINLLYIMQEWYE